MSAIQTRVVDSSTVGLIPEGVYVLKITKVDNTDSKSSGQPMLTLRCVLITKDGSDIVGDGFRIGGRETSPLYMSFSEKAIERTCSGLSTLGVSPEEMALLTDTSDTEWINRNLQDKFFQATVGNEVLYRASDMKSYTEDRLERLNEGKATKISFILDGRGNKVKCGANYKIVDIVGPASDDGQPY